MDHKVEWVNEMTVKVDDSVYTVEFFNSRWTGFMPLVIIWTCSHDHQRKLDQEMVDCHVDANRVINTWLENMWEMEKK